MSGTSRIIYRREDVRVREVDRKFTGDGSYVARYAVEIDGEALFRHFVSLLEAMDAVMQIFSEREALRRDISKIVSAAEQQAGYRFG